MTTIETAVTSLGREVTRLTADLARVTGERDRARDLAAALESEMAGALVVPLTAWSLWEIGDHRGNIVAACQDLVTDWFAS